MPSWSRIKPWLTPSPTFIRTLKFLALLLTGLLAVFLGALTIHRGILPIIAWVFPSLRQSFWDWSVYGPYPTETYVSFDLRGPESSVIRWEESCDDGLVFASIYGPSTYHDGPSILDPKGKLVWTTDEYGTVINLRVQKWRGKDHITFWAGEKSGSTGSGAYFILDSAYNLVKKVHAVGEGLKGDIHEFEITEQDTALITVYAPLQMDTRAMGLWRPDNGWIMDSMFQEIDIESGELLFEWKASEHFRPEETFYSNPFAGRSWNSGPFVPFDFFHINSIQKDSLGNYLVSSRHLHTVSYINGESGEVEWSLGGNYTDFEDLSNGHASDFRWQHHAHWFSEEEQIISLFDNQAAGPLHEDAPYSKGVLIQLDLENSTARLLQQYISVGQARSASQGSVQLLEPNDHVFTGWGSSGAYTEFNIAGDALCEVHLSAESSFWWERIKSYRTYKVFDWVGKPELPPMAVISGDNLFVSWNGATEVRSWELQGTDFAEHEEDSEAPVWSKIKMIAKDGFEGSFELPNSDEFLMYRVAALDEEKMYIGFSKPASFAEDGSGIFGFLTGVVAAVACIAGLWFGLKVWLRRRRGRLGSAPVASTGGSSGSVWELSSVAKVFGRKGKEYEYSKLPE